MDRPLTDRHIEHRKVLRGEIRRPDDRPVLVDVGDDLLDLLVVVAERLERERNRAIDDRHLPAADELLELDEREVRFHPGRVAIHQERNRPRRCKASGLGVAVAGHLTGRDRVVPFGSCCREKRGVRTGRVGDRVGRVAMHPHHVVVSLAVLLVAIVRTDRRGDPSRADVAAARHQRGDRRRGPATGI